jgi:microcystin-dependent protein
MALTKVTENILDIDSIAPVLAPAVAGIITSATVNTPPGTVVFHCGSTAPSGYLKANGATVSRTTYSSLFSALGTTFGAGDGSTTFNLPDLRGEFVRGWDDGRGIDSGRTFGSFQDGFMTDHTHTNTHTHTLSHTHTMAHTHAGPSHSHRTSMGFDTGNIYGWCDAQGNPAFGSEVIAGANRIVNTTTYQTNQNIRIGYTEASGTGNTGGASNGTTSDASGTTTSGSSNSTTSGSSVTTSSTVRPRNVSLLACIKF